MPAADQQRAERLCRELLRIDPQQQDARQLLALLEEPDSGQVINVTSPRRSPSGPLHRAAKNYLDYWTTDADSTEALLAEGEEDLAAGACGEAIESFQRALEQQPDDLAAREKLGEAYFAAHQYEKAIAELQPLIETAPRRLTARRMMAEAYLQLRDPAAAAQQLEEALRIDPRDADLQYKLGRIYLVHRQFAAADRCLSAALQLDSDHEAAWHDRGAMLLNQGNLSEAKRHFSETLSRNPQHVDALCNLGLIHFLTNDLTPAAEYCHRALAINPKHASTRNILGNIKRGQGLLSEAVSQFQQAIQLNAAYSEAHNNLALSYQTQGRMEEAVSHYRRALEVRANCATTHSNLLLSLHYLPENDLDAHYREHLNWAAAHGGQQRFEEYTNSREPNRRLRIGYVSPDFRAHPVGQFIEPILRNHDPAQFEVTCYSNATTPDDVTARLESIPARWRVTNWQTDDDLAATIRDDGIDILIDLAGHTAGNRLTLFARKPAPVQMTYLGYGGTTGLETMDYRLTDAVADPESDPVRHTEELVRLRHGLLCYLPPQHTPDVSPAPQLRNGYITFGSFNNPAKINAAAIAVWAKVLKAVPASRLLLKYPTYRDDGTKTRCRELFAKQGVPADRLEFRGGKLPMEQHLASYADIDIMLDTMPYTGSTTTCESLWMGVPVLTLLGNSFVGRISASLLSQLEMPELIAETTEEYVDIAVKLAAASEQLSDVRSRIREEMQSSPICDAIGYTRELESIYRNVWRSWCEPQR